VLRRLIPIVATLGALLLPTTRARAQDRCFTRLDNGVDLTGWHKSATNHHGPGDGWRVSRALTRASRRESRSASARV
jgi:hypothetical protein